MLARATSSTGSSLIVPRGLIDSLTKVRENGASATDPAPFARETELVERLADASLKSFSECSPVQTRDQNAATD